MNSKYNYNMTFMDVLNEIFETHGWYQGEDFADGVFIAVENDIVKLRLFSADYSGVLDELTIYPAITRQKYRRCYTQPDIERKV